MVQKLALQPLLSKLPIHYSPQETLSRRKIYKKVICECSPTLFADFSKGSLIIKHTYELPISQIIIKDWVIELKKILFFHKYIIIQFMQKYILSMDSINFQLKKTLHFILYLKNRVLKNGIIQYWSLEKNMLMYGI